MDHLARKTKSSKLGSVVAAGGRIAAFAWNGENRNYSFPEPVMCGRFALHTPRSRIAERYFGFHKPVGDIVARYNIAPGTEITIIRSDSEATEGGVSFDFSLWGFRPRWASDEKAPQPINAKSETVATSRYFRNAFAHRRCLIPASGWYEWRQTGDGKQPYYITLSDTDDEVLFFAGIWEPAGTNTETRCAILTQPAAKTLSFIHDRQPVVLDPECRRAWLDTEMTEREAIKGAARPLDPARLQAYPVSTRVNRPVNDDETLTQPVEV